MRKYIAGGVVASAALALGLLGAAPASAAQDSVTVIAQGGLESVDVVITNTTGGDIECFVGGVEADNPNAIGFELPDEVVYPAGTTPIHFDEVAPGDYRLVFSCLSFPLEEAWISENAFVGGPPTNPQPGIWVVQTPEFTVTAPVVDPGNCFGSVCF